MAGLLSSADCLYKITSADNLRDGNEAGIVYADSRAMLADRVLALRRANIYERQTYRHIVGMPRLTARGDLRQRRPRSWWSGRCAMAGWICSSPAVTATACGTTVDRLRFAERIVICDSSHFDTLVAIPL